MKQSHGNANADKARTPNEIDDSETQNPLISTPYCRYPYIRPNPCRRQLEPAKCNDISYLPWWLKINSDRKYAVCSRCRKWSFGEDIIYECPENESKHGEHDYRYLLCPKCVDDLNSNKKDEIVAVLDEDIWALAYVVARNRQKMPCSMVCILCMVYFIQILTLSVMVWGYSVMWRYDIKNEYELFGECGLTYINDTETNHELSSSTTYAYHKESVEITCDAINLVELGEERQSWDVGLDGSADKTFNLCLFILAVPCSFLLLGIYILSSMSNPATFAAIGDEYPMHKKCRYIIRCESIAGYLNCSSQLNRLLSLAAFELGFVVMVSYPWYFGIESPVDIILTPIALVFVLEMDNWMFIVAKQMYPEAHIHHLWSFKRSHFKRKHQDSLGKELRKNLKLLIVFFGLNVSMANIAVIFMSSMKTGIWSSVVSLNVTLAVAFGAGSLFSMCVLATFCPIAYFKDLQKWDATYVKDGIDYEDEMLRFDDINLYETDVDNHQKTTSGDNKEDEEELSVSNEAAVVTEENKPTNIIANSDTSQTGTPERIHGALQLSKMNAFTDVMDVHISDGNQQTQKEPSENKNGNNETGDENDHEPLDVVNVISVDDEEIFGSGEELKKCLSTKL